MKIARPVNDKSPNVTNPFSATHRGVDYGYPIGTPIYAGEDGVVTIAKDGETRQWLANTPTDPYKPSTGKRPLLTEDYGNFIKIAHNEDYKTLYAHLKIGSVLVKNGDAVVKGQKIGEVGTSGNSTNFHLHWEIRKYETPVDPITVLDADFTDYKNTMQPIQDTQAIIEKLRLERDTNWNLFVELRKMVTTALELPEDAINDTVVRSINAIRGNADKLQTVQKEFDVYKESSQATLSIAQDQLLKSNALRESLSGQYNDSLKKITGEYESMITAKDKEITAAGKQLAECQNSRPYCSAIGRLLRLCK